MQDHTRGIHDVLDFDPQHSLFALVITTNVDDAADLRQIWSACSLEFGRKRIIRKDGVPQGRACCSRCGIIGGRILLRGLQAIIAYDLVCCLPSI